MTNDRGQRTIHCAYCGKEIPSPPADAAEREKVYCSFSCEVKGLLGGLNRGFRWLAVSLAWGLVLFALLGMPGRVLLGYPVSNPASYYGLMLVLALMTVLLTVVFRRMK
jgi:hypothetical protein